MAEQSLNLTAFEGPWQLSRQIEDRKAGHVITGQGSCVFAADGPERMIYDEEIVLNVPGQAPLSGTRRYFWEQHGREIAVLFSDGRGFHRLTPGRSGSEDVHICDPDLYRGRYDFANWPQWTAIWRVTGPRKDYVMTTKYRR